LDFLQWVRSTGLLESTVGATAVLRQQLLFCYDGGSGVKSLTPNQERRQVVFWNAQTEMGRKMLAEREQLGHGSAGSPRCTVHLNLGKAATPATPPMLENLDK
jgi:hypothetical protein